VSRILFAPLRNASAFVRFRPAFLDLDFFDLAMLMTRDVKQQPQSSSFYRYPEIAHYISAQQY
jgi:hypothetical protein